MNFKAALTLTLGLLITSPAMALDQGHEQLLNALGERDVVVAINPPQVCEMEGREDLQGVYFYSPRHGKGAIAICQDNAINSDEVQWTANDLDTLRHEAFHYLQDCIGGLDGDMNQYFDGPGGISPDDGTYEEVWMALSVMNINPYDIINRYIDMGADELTVKLELEAFMVASMANGDDIAELVQDSCPIP